MASFKVNRTFNFSPKTQLYSNMLFSASYNGLKLVSIISAEEAAKHSDIYTIHKNVLAAYSQDTSTTCDIPTSVEDCSFLLFKTGKDQTFVIAEEYIDSSTIVVSSKRTCIYTVYNVEDSDIDTISNFIKSLGYTAKYDKKEETI